MVHAEGGICARTSTGCKTRASQQCSNKADTAARNQPTCTLRPNGTVNETVNTTNDKPALSGHGAVGVPKVEVEGESGLRVESAARVALLFLPIQSGQVRSNPRDSIGLRCRCRHAMQWDATRQIGSDQIIAAQTLQHITQHQTDPRSGVGIHRVVSRRRASPLFRSPMTHLCPYHPSVHRPLRANSRVSKQTRKDQKTKR